MSKVKPHKTNTQTPVAVGYVRVSTLKQDISLEAQAEKIQAMVVLQGVQLLEIIEDSQSAKDIDRPGMARLLNLVDSGKVQTVIIAKLDRLTRSVRDLGILLERFEKHGVALVSVSESLDTGSASGRLVLRLLCSVSEWEREIIGERTAIALQHMKAHLQVFNHTPYGFSRDGSALVASAEEQAVISRVHILRSNGEALGSIAGTLNAEGVPTKKAGGKWYASTIKNLLENSIHKAA